MAKHHLPYPKKKHSQDNHLKFKVVPLPYWPLEHLKFKVVPLPHWPLEDLSPPTVFVTIKTTHSQFFFQPIKTNTTRGSPFTCIVNHRSFILLSSPSTFDRQR
jgi:hypothetical protein